MCEGLWLKRQLEELKVEYESPMIMYCDNQDASIVRNPFQHDKSKNVGEDRHC